MKSKQFFSLVKKFVVFCAIFFMADFFMGQIFKYLHNICYEKAELSSTMSSDYCIKSATPDIVIIGSSTASHHYISQEIEDSLGLNTYNFAKDGCFFLYQTLLINSMLDRYAPGNIIWEIGETALSDAYDVYEYQSIDRLYPYYSNPLVREIVDKKDSFQKIRMMFNSYRYNSDLLRYLLTYKHSEIDTLKGYIPIDTSGYSYPTKSFSIEDSTVNNYKIELLRNTLRRCLDCHINVVVTSSPRFYHKEVLSHSDSYNALVNVLNEFNIPLLDFYFSEPFASDSTMFKDNAHMNSKGAKEYMTQFIPQYKKFVTY